jgi:ribonucleoside-diphosphate reductase alpha chain
MSSTIFVIKRNGTKEELNFDKINNVLMWACEGIKNVSASDIAMNAKLQMVDGVKTIDIHNILIQSACDLISEETPNYQFVASNLLNYLLRKQVFEAKDTLPTLYEVIKKNVDWEIYDKLILEKYSETEIQQIDKWIKHNRDFNLTYAGIQQLVDKYLLKDRFTGKIYETPQYMYMLIAMTIFMDYKTDRLKWVKKFYDHVSLFKLSLPTPIMAGVRTPNRQWSSCTLIDVDDSLNSIFHSNAAIGYYSAKRAGIGLNFGRIRAVGDKIRGGEVVHTGVIPYLKMFEATVKSVTQNGIRGGSATAYFPWWHKEAMQIMVLKNNKGTDDNRVRKLDYAIQFNKLFYQRVIEDGTVTLFSPGDLPNLYEAFFESNEAFEELYLKYENNKNIKSKKVKARDLFNSFLQERIGTGRLYVMNVDNVNSHSSFVDKIYMSNLCVEVTLPTKPLQHIDDGDNTDSEIALCVLSAINLGEIKDLSELEDITESAVRALDYVVEHQDYPVAAARKMLKRRSLGIGITNVAYYLAKNDLGYEDKEALKLMDQTMEYIQYYSIKASVKLAQEFGKCEYFDRTKYSLGVLPIDTYKKEVDSIIKRKHTLDWEALRADVQEYGMRNSTLTAVMPCESSSLVTNSTNGIEPVRALIISKKSKQGVLKVVVPEFNKLKNKYTLAYDMKDNKSITNIQAVIQKWIDQAISSNHYYDFTKNAEGEISTAELGMDILYAYKMGAKTLYYANSNDGKSDDHEKDLKSLEKEPKNDVSLEVQTTDDAGCESGACSV